MRWSASRDGQAKQTHLPVTGRVNFRWLAGRLRTAIVTRTCGGDYTVHDFEEIRALCLACRRDGGARVQAAAESGGWSSCPPSAAHQPRLIRRQAARAARARATACAAVGAGREAAPVAAQRRGRGRGGAAPARTAAASGLRARRGGRGRGDGPQPERARAGGGGIGGQRTREGREMCARRCRRQCRVAASSARPAGGSTQPQGECSLARAARARDRTLR